MFNKLKVLLSLFLVIVSLTLATKGDPGSHTATSQVIGTNEDMRERPSITREGIEGYGRIPLYFEVNKGQADPKVRYLSRGNGYILFLTENEAVISINDVDSELVNSGSALRMNWIGGSQNVFVSGIEELEGKINYLKGNNSRNWQTNIPTYQKVRYQNIYPGIDLIYYGNQRKLEYDFVVAPNASPGAIQISFSGSEEIRLDKDGNLEIGIGGKKLIQHAPLIYQNTAEGKKIISGKYIIKSTEPKKASGLVYVGFDVGRYDTTRPLIIDPIFSFSTYLGGNGLEQGQAIALDDSGNIYVVGKTASTNFPTSNSLRNKLTDKPFGKHWRRLRGREDGTNTYDAFITKLNPSGTAIIYSTYLGGNDIDNGQSIAIDSSGNPCIVGSTKSADFPTTDSIQKKLSPCESMFYRVFGGLIGNGISCFDVFVTKLNASGSDIIYSTYLGGRNMDRGHDIALDDSDNIYITGSTSSSDFPTVRPINEKYGGRNDAFVMKLDASGKSIVFSTYLGGSATDYGNGISVDRVGNIFVVGDTESSDFPTMRPILGTYRGGKDAFVAKITSDGMVLDYSTYLGGSGDEYGYDIAVDHMGNAHVVGHTNSNDFPTSNPIQGALRGDYDVFVSKIDASGSDFIYSTYFGGKGFDYSYDIVLDGLANACITGDTSSFDLPMVNAVTPTAASDNMAYVAKFNPSGSAIIFSTYIGGSAIDEAFGIAADDLGNLYVSGWTESTDFPVVESIQNEYGGGEYDAFVMKIEFENNQ